MALQYGIYASWYWLVVCPAYLCLLATYSRKQSPGCRGQWRRDMKPVSLYLGLLTSSFQKPCWAGHVLGLIPAGAHMHGWMPSHPNCCRANNCSSADSAPGPKTVESGLCELGSETDVGFHGGSKPVIWMRDEHVACNGR